MTDICRYCGKEIEDFEFCIEGAQLWCDSVGKLIFEKYRLHILDCYECRVRLYLNDKADDHICNLIVIIEILGLETLIKICKRDETIDYKEIYDKIKEFDLDIEILDMGDLN